MMTKTTAGKPPAKRAAVPAPKPATRATASAVAKTAAKAGAKPAALPGAKKAPSPAATAGSRSRPAAKRSAAAKAAAPTESTLVHPRSVATIAPPDDFEEAPEQVFAEGPQDEIDPDLRYRMISEIAYRRYVERGYADGGDIDDWLQAEAEVDHLLANRGRSADSDG